MSALISEKNKSRELGRFARILEAGLGLWLCLGLFLILSSMVWSLKGTTYITRIHLGWVLPSIIFCVVYWRFFLKFWASSWPLLLFFVSILFASAFVVEDNSGIGRDLEAVFSLIFGMPAIVRLMLERKFLVMDIVLFFSGFIVCGYVLFELYTLYFNANGRIGGRFQVFPLLDNPLYMAQYVGALAVFCLASGRQVYENKGYIWPLFFMMFLILSFAGFKTESRSWLVAMALVILVVMYSTKKFAWLTFGLCVAVGGVWVFKDQVLVRGFSFSHRDEIWMEGIRQGVQRPLGQGSVAELQVLRWWEPHNIFLTIWLKYGFVPLSFFMCFLVWVVNAVRVSHPKKVFEWLLPLTFGLGMLFFEGANVIHKPNESWLLIWIPICLMLAGKMTEPEKAGFVKIGKRA